MLSWTTRQTNDHTTYQTRSEAQQEQAIRQAFESCTDKAIELLDTTIQDDSLYLMFEWDPATNSLSIVVTDVSKTRDATASVECVFSGLDNHLTQTDEIQKLAYADTIKFWLHDYLSTCTAFFSYSLVAIFHSSTRSNTELL